MRQVEKRTFRIAGKNEDGSSEVEFYIAYFSEKVYKVHFAACWVKTDISCPLSLLSDFYGFLRFYWTI
jgi:hypothetical protein